MTINPVNRAQHEFDKEAVEAIQDPYQRLRVIMKRLLDPGGCPWDREQDHKSLRQYLIEEAYEVADAIEDENDAELCEELGDVALQVVFHSELAERRDAFRIEDVYDHICEKLIRRHPHVFGETEAKDSEAVLRNWEQIKQEEKRKKKERASAIAGVPRALPALQRAGRLQEKASKVGFDWDRPEDVAAKVREEVEEFLEHVVAQPPASRPTDELTQNEIKAEAAGKLNEEALTEEFGDLLFSLVNLSRFLNIRAEEAMERACNKFIRRFTAVEAETERQRKHLKDLTLAEMDAIWDSVKKQEKPT